MCVVCDDLVLFGLRIACVCYVWLVDFWLFCLIVLVSSYNSRFVCFLVFDFGR